MFKRLIDVVGIYKKCYKAKCIYNNYYFYWLAFNYCSLFKKNKYKYKSRLTIYLKNINKTSLNIGNLIDLSVTISEVVNIINNISCQLKTTSLIWILLNTQKFKIYPKVHIKNIINLTKTYNFHTEAGVKMSRQRITHQQCFYYWFEWL